MEEDVTEYNDIEEFISDVESGEFDKDYSFGSGWLSDHTDEFYTVFVELEQSDELYPRIKPLPSDYHDLFEKGGRKSFSYWAENLVEYTDILSPWGEEFTGRIVRDEIDIEKLEYLLEEVSGEEPQTPEEKEMFYQDSIDEFLEERNLKDGTN